MEILMLMLVENTSVMNNNDHLINCFSSLSEEFSRAVYVATGINLTRHLVNIVFKIFDEDHDSKLSHKEFIGVMKDRLHRGDRVRQPRTFISFVL